MGEIADQIFDDMLAAEADCDTRLGCLTSLDDEDLIDCAQNYANYFEWGVDCFACKLIKWWQDYRFLTPRQRQSLIAFLASCPEPY